MGRSSTSDKKGGCGIIGFGIFWTLFSSIFVVAGVWLTWKTIAVEGWQKTPCVIERFEINANQSQDPPFQADLIFHYEINGTRHTGTKLWPDKKGSDDIEDLSKLREEFSQGPEGPMPSPAGTSAECRVNPENPAEAALLTGGKGAIWGGIAFAVFGAVFVSIGIALIGLGIRKPGSVSSARSAVRGRQASPVVMGFIFLIFGGAGLALLFGLVVPKAREWWQMRQWTPTDAQVVWSRVVSKSSDDGTTYAVDILYRYNFNGRSHLANRRNLMGGSSSGYDRKKAFVDAHPPGSALQVFVDPAKPWRAVIQRDMGWWALFGLFPLPFLAIGFFGLRSSLRKRGSPTPSFTEPVIAPGRSSGLVRTGAVPVIKSGEWVRIGHVPVAGLIFVIIFAAIWNGVVWGPMRDSGAGDGLGFFFFLPFALVGIAVIAAVIYSLFSLLGPKYEIQIDESNLARGESTQVRWRRSGRASATSFALYLVAKEEASYRNGSSTSTATSVFHEQVLFETSVPMAMEKGHVELRIPSDALPSFHGTSNRLRWFLALRAGIPRLPDVRGEREITVRIPTKEEMP